jgi:ribosomal protein S17E
MFISCIVLKAKDEIKKMSKEARESYRTRLNTEFYHHLRCVQENPFQTKDLKEISGEHMQKVSKLIEWMDKK